MRALSPP